MRWFTLLGRRVRLLFRSDAVEREMDEEMRFHLEMEAVEMRRRGEADAERIARRSFGGVERHKEDARDARGGRWMQDVGRDVRYAIRALRRSPAYSIVAVLTLAIGIGANTAIVSVVNGVLLRPLPYAEPERVVVLNSTVVGQASAVSVPDFLDWRSDARSFSGLSAAYTSTVTLTGSGTPERLSQARVSANVLDVLGVRPAAGRGFAPGEDDRTAPRVAMISYGLWQSRFGGDASAIGRTIVLDGYPTTIVGVAPRTLRWPEAVDVWLTTRFTERDGSPGARGARWISVIGRLAPGVTLAGARAEMSSIAARLARIDPQHNTDVGTRLQPLLADVVGDLRTPLLVLLGAVGFVLLIACANVASLTLGRTAARRGELAVRSALGAARARIVRQIVVEGVVLAAVGGVAGVLLALAGVRALVAIAPSSIPRLDDVHVDATVLLVTAALTLATGLLFALVPALQGSRMDLAARLRAAGRTGSGFDRAGARRGLVIAEVAAAIVLLAGAGLLLRSFLRLRDVDPGFRPDGVATFSVTLSPTRYPTPAAQRQFTETLLERLRRVQGVEHAATTFALPLSGASFGFTFDIAGRDVPSGRDEPRAQARVASPDYLATMGIPLLRGRAFDERDRAGAPQAVLISEAVARRYFSNEDPIGKRVRTGWGSDEGLRFGGEIVGIVGDVRQYALSGTPTPHIYMPAAQWPLDELTVVIRSQRPSSAVIADARAIVHELDPELPLYDAMPLTRLVDASLGQRRFYMTLLGAFAVVALVLAAVGIYGVIAYTVQQRRREIGIRIALGASARRVVGMVVARGLTLAIVGALLGVAGALALTRLLGSLLFGVSPRDPLTLLAAPVVLLAVAVLASVMPARRAARMDPMETIRVE